MQAGRRSVMFLPQKKASSVSGFNKKRRQTWIDVHF